MRLFMLLVICGLCSACTSSPFVGTWHTDHLPAQGMPEAATSSTAVFHNDGACVATFMDAQDNLVIGVNGKWTQVSDSQIDITSAQFDSTATGTLLDKNALLIAGDGVAVRYERQQQ